tara:strand:- start:4479 stop:5453 length:975 start_codon:yes stop_codon:yes gene_type:complete
VKNIAIIGAGMTGLSLAYNLQGNNISIFDKSWRPGGRVSTRKHGDLLFDHGAHYLSVNHNVNQLKQVLIKINITKVIEINFLTNFKEKKSIKKKIIISKNGMNLIPNTIHQSLNVNSYFNSKIIKIIKNKNNLFNLYTENDEYKNFDLILICIPYLQAKELSSNFINVSDNHEPIYEPIYTVMLSYENSNNIEIDGGLNLDKNVAFYMKQNFKFPELKNENWVVNMSSEYTEKNLNINNYDLEKYAQSIFEKSFKIKQSPTFIKTHRWLYAQTKTSYNHLSKKNWISSKDNKVFLTGDWVLGKSLSDAWNAGLKLSHYLKILDI